jgi:hypothetical protein
MNETDGAAGGMAYDAMQPPVMETLPGPPPAPKTVTCPTCGHVATWDGPGDPGAQIIRCDNCGQRIAYGVAIARCTCAAHPEDSRFMLFTFDHRVPGKEARFTVTVDAVLAREFAAATVLLSGG